LRSGTDSEGIKPDPKAPYYEQVANKLIEQLEAGTAPWQKPWEPGTIHLPHNPGSGTRYKGSNALWLEMQGREDPRWMTYKQAQGVGAQVRRGEKGTLVQYWKLTDQIPVKDERAARPGRRDNTVYRSVQAQRLLRRISTPSRSRACPRSSTRPPTGTATSGPKRC
jgi:antirestriction protein ArdC